MPEYLVRYQGIAHDHYAGFSYDVDEVRIIETENANKAYESAKQNLKTLEEKLHMPEIKITRLAEVGEEINFYDR